MEELRITLYGEEGRSMNRPFKDYVNTVKDKTDLEFTHIVYHIKVLLELIKEESKKVVEAIETDSAFLAIKMPLDARSANFHAELFKDLTVGGSFDPTVVVKRVEQTGQLSPTIGVFRDERSFEDVLKRMEKHNSDKFTTEFFDISPDELQKMIEDDPNK